MGIAHQHPTPDVFLPAQEKELVLTDPLVQYPRKPDALIVLSGGMDSTTMLYEFRARIALAVTFDYGSNHNAREIACAVSGEWKEQGRLAVRLRFPDTPSPL